ncbi:MAG: VWA domain-containing protein [Candidatus Muirbacterium halophilum]|nr:VWA domain-containing protein [Candidatus Muirbacterium halophilum]
MENNIYIPGSGDYKKGNILKYCRYIIRGICLILIVFAIAGPQHYLEKEIFYGDGIDIMLAVDTSTSMLAEDFSPNRLEASKKVINRFIDGRKNDRIGLVVFAGAAINRVPFTLDYAVLKDFLNDVDFYMLPDGTAIGNALATAISRFEKSNSKSKIVVLLTDGVNNAGEIHPETAAKTAHENGIKIYTVGVGKEGRSVIKVKNNQGFTVPTYIDTHIDEELLKKISSLTGGKYYRAQDMDSLEDIYNDISELEKTKIESQVFAQVKEYFPHLLYIALILLFSEILLFDILFKRLP